MFLYLYKKKIATGLFISQVSVTAEIRDHALWTLRGLLFGRLSIVHPLVAQRHNFNLNHLGWKEAALKQKKMDQKQAGLVQADLNKKSSMTGG